MSFSPRSSLRTENREGRAASDSCSEKSFGTMASPESIQLKTSTTDRRFKIAGMNARMVEAKTKVLQKMKQKQGQDSQGGESDDANRNTPEVPLSGRSAASSMAMSTLPLSQRGPAAISLEDVHSKVQSRQLEEMMEEMMTLSNQLGDQKKQIDLLGSTTASIASQKSLEDFMARMEEQHKEHVEEMLHLQESFPTESECQGLRVELNASKSRQQSLEQQQVLLERSWAEEKAALEKELSRLRSRETTLMQQLKQAIAETPPPKIEESLPPTPPRKPRILLGIAALAGLFLAGVVAGLGRHRSTPEPHHKGIGFLGVDMMRGKICGKVKHQLLQLGKFGTLYPCSPGDLCLA
eukprot:s156_g8.t1